MQCPICQKPVPVPAPAEPLPAHFPFCSDRCKLIDLGRWLEGKYQIPVEPENEDNEQPADPDRP